MKHHLSEEEIGAVLAGDVSGKMIAEHLASCEFCGSKVNAFRSSVADFNDFTQAWAKDRLLHRAFRLDSKLSDRSAWLRFAPALASSVALGLALVGWSLHNPKPRPVSPAQTPRGTNLAEVAEDNQWMFAMSADLRWAPYSIVKPEPESKPVRHKRSGVQRHAEVLP